MRNLLRKPIRTGSMVVSAWPMWLLGLVAMIDNIDQYIVRGSGTRIEHAFHVGTVTIAILFSAFIFVNGLVTLPAGYMADRWDRTKVMAITITAWSVISAIGGLVPTDAFFLLIMVRGMLGFGQAVTDPSGSSLLADYYGRERRGRAYSVQQCLNYAGFSIGLEIGSLIATHVSFHHVAGWRLAFFVSLIPGLIIAILVWRLPEPRRGSADRAHVTQSGTMEISTERQPLFPEGFGNFMADLGRGLWTDVKTLLRIRTMRYALVGVSAILFTVTSIATWMTYFYKHTLHMNPTRANLLFGLLVLLGAIPSTIIGGFVADRWVNKFAGARVVIPGVSLAIAATVLIISFIPMPFAGVYCLQFIGFFFATFSVPALRAGLSDSVPAQLRGTGFGAFNLATAIFGSAAAPLVTAGIANAYGNDFRTAFLVVMPFALAGALFLLRARKFIEGDTAKIFEAVVAAMAAEQARTAAKEAE